MVQTPASTTFPTFSSAVRSSVIIILPLQFSLFIEGLLKILWFAALICIKEDKMNYDFGNLFLVLSIQIVDLAPYGIRQLMPQ